VDGSGIDDFFKVVDELREEYIRSAGTHSL